MEDPTGADGADASDDFFRSRITGLSSSSAQIQITSDDDPTDSYTQRLVPDDGSLVQPDFAVLYNGDMELATDDAPMTTAEDSEILDGLQLDAVHNQSTTSTITIGNQKFTRTMQAAPAPQFSFTSDVVDVGGQIAGNLALPANYLGWTITVSASNGQTSAPLLDTANDVSFDLNASAAGYITITATATPTVFGFQSESLANSAVVDVLQPGTMSTYAQQAWSALHVNGVVQGDPIVRNRLITKLYTQMFDMGPPIPFASTALNPYEWFGIAAFVSNQAGTAMAAALEYGFDLPGAPNPQQVFAGLAQGNFAIFTNMYPQGLAYEAGRMSAINAMVQQQQMTREQQNAWDAINNALGENNATLWEAGVTELAKVEQEVVLQTVVNQNRPLWKQVTQSWATIFFPLVSGIPGASMSFDSWADDNMSLIGSNIDFGDGVERYQYFVNYVFPKWLIWRQSHDTVNVAMLLGGDY